MTELEKTAELMAIIESASGMSADMLMRLPTGHIAAWAGTPLAKRKLAQPVIDALLSRPTKPA